MHDHGVVHRDLKVSKSLQQRLFIQLALTKSWNPPPSKYENIMFESTAQDAAIKIIDFGLSKKFIGKTGTMTERVGTIYTMSPQVLLGNYSAEADLWGVGVIAFMLCSSVKPFYDKRRSVLIDQIMRCKYSFESPVWSNVSEDAKDFISKLLVVDPKERLDAAQALGHKWIVNRERLHDEVPSEEVLSKVDGSLLNYRHTSRLKKLALTVIAHRSTTAEMQKLRSIFQEFDKTQDGVLSFDEFRQALEKMNYPEDTLTEIFDSVDFNQNGHIMWTEVSQR
jgi:serine/threonine protein kinase